MSTGPAWPDATIARLRALWANGVSTSQIGLDLGFSKNAVHGKVHRLGLPARPSPIIRDGVPRAARPPQPPRAPRVTLPALAAAPVFAAPTAPQPRVRELTGRCCWPIGMPKTKEFRYCDVACDAKASYCAAHSAEGTVPRSHAYYRHDQSVPA